MASLGKRISLGNKLPCGNHTIATIDAAELGSELDCRLADQRAPVSNVTKRIDFPIVGFRIKACQRRPAAAISCRQQPLLRKRVCDLQQSCERQLLANLND